MYKGHDVMPWCPRCGTGISEHEIVTEGYQERTHLAIYRRVSAPGRAGRQPPGLDDDTLDAGGQRRRCRPPGARPMFVPSRAARRTTLPRRLQRSALRGEFTVIARGQGC